MTILRRNFTPPPKPPLASEVRFDMANKFRLSVDTAVRMKKVMIKRGITRAVTDCPCCGGQETLNGRLGTDSRGQQYVLRMWCKTPQCLRMLE